MKILQGKWKSDGSDDPSRGAKATSWEVTATDSSSDQMGTNHTKIDINSNEGSPMNLMYELDRKESSYFVFQATVVQLAGNVSIGAVSPSDFCAGYKLNKAKLFNGNLTNGAGAVQTNFSPHHVKQGDTVLVEYKVDKEEQEMIPIVFYLNGVCLGCGFQVPKTSMPLYPCLSVNGNVQLQVATLSSLPSESTTQTFSSSEFIGSYNIIEAIVDSGEVLIPFQDDNIAVGGTAVSNESNDDNCKPISLSIHHDQEQNGEDYGFSIKVCNVMSVKKRFLKRIESSDFTSPESSNGVTLSTDDFVFTTRMMAPPPYNEVERKLSKFMSSKWHSIEKSTSNKTLTFFNEQKQPIMKCVSS